MRSYQLDDAMMDKEFLSGKPTKCRAVVPVQKDQIFLKDEPLLVILSNGKKFKGKISSFEYVQVDQYYIGDLIIQKF
jgi:hypothetical protein